MIDFANEAQILLSGMKKGVPMMIDHDLMAELTRTNGKMTAKAWLSRAFAAYKDGRIKDSLLCLQGAVGKEKFPEKEFRRLRALRILCAKDLEPASVHSEGGMTTAKD